MEPRAGKEEIEPVVGRGDPDAPQPFHHSGPQGGPSAAKNEPEDDDFGEDQSEDEASLRPNGAHGPNLVDPLKSGHHHRVVDDHQRYDEDDEYRDVKSELRQADELADQASRFLPRDRFELEVIPRGDCRDLLHRLLELFRVLEDYCGAQQNAVVHLVLRVDSPKQLFSTQSTKVAGLFVSLIDDPWSGFGHDGSRGTEKLVLGSRAIDRFRPSKLLQLVDLLDFIGREVPVKIAERDQVHQVQVSGQGRVLHAFELESPVNRHVHRLDVTAPCERLDGEHVAHADPVQLQKGRQLVVEECEAAREVVIIHVEKVFQQSIKVGLLGPQLLLQAPHRDFALDPIELKDDFLGLCLIVLQQLLGLRRLALLYSGKDALALVDHCLLDLIQALRCL